MSYQSKHTGTEIDASVDTTQQILNMIYPVGSIYMSVNNVSPATFIGGTWTALTDRVLIGAGSSYTVNATGGTATTTLTTSNMPAHTHVFTGNNTSTSSTGSHTHDWAYMSHGGNTFQFFNADSSGGSWVGDTQFMIAAKRNQGETSGVNHILSTSNLMTGNPLIANGAHSHTITVTGANSSVGSGASFSNLPPYLAVYMWKRTA